ncbi:MAG: cation:proton antiporter subunit C [Clostridia bacterium]
MNLNIIDLELFEQLLTEHFEETISVVLFAIGFTTLLLSKNLIKKIIGLNIMDTAVYLFLAVKGYIEGGKAPIIVDGITSTEYYINPIPSGLVLTGIVVSVSVTAILLAMTIRLYRRYNTLNLDEIMMHYAKEVS